MTLNFDKIRAEYEKMQEAEKKSSGDGGDFLQKFLKIPEGNSTIRILPSNKEEQMFYAETSIHRIPNGKDEYTGKDKDKNVHCLKVHDKPCPMCDAYYELWRRVNAGDKKWETLAKKIKPRARYYMNVVDRQAEEENSDDSPIRIFSVGIMIFKKIINTILDEDFGDVTDIETGRDFRLHKVMEGPWPKYDQSVFRPKQTAAGTKKQIAEYMDSLHDIHGLVKEEDYTEVKQMAESLLLGGEVPQESPAQTSSKEESPVGDDDYLARLKND